MHKLFWAWTMFRLLKVRLRLWLPISLIAVLGFIVVGAVLAKLAKKTAKRSWNKTKGFSASPRFSQLQPKFLKPKIYPYPKALANLVLNLILYRIPEGRYLKILSLAQNLRKGKQVFLRFCASLNIDDGIFYKFILIFKRLSLLKCRFSCHRQAIKESSSWTGKLFYQ